jgi:hypothetical protein
MDEMLKQSRKEFLKREKDRKDFFKDLESRSKKFGEPIPDEILIRACGAHNGIIYVGSDFFEKYRKWIE